jgi:uncharacterized protein (DUF1697 family)
MGATQYIAFLRAVNVGGRVVKMAELKKLFESLGFADVSTFIASGNVVFTSTKSATVLHDAIEKALRKSLGYAVVTMIRSAGEVTAVAAHAAFPPRALTSGTLYVGFMRDKAGAGAINNTLALQTPIDSLHIDGREVYWLARKNIAEASITGSAIEKALQTPVTFRNINTVRRLAAKFA